MKKFLLLIFYMFFCTGLFSQVLTIQEAGTDKPLDLVTVFSRKPQLFAMTNAMGQADISAFKKSEHIELRIIGYKSLVFSYKDLLDSDFKVYMHSVPLTLEQVVISGSRWNQVSADISSRITSISPHEIALMNPQTAADLLGSSGEVFIQKSQQGGGSPMIRGFATNRLLYTIDGVRMNTAIFRGGNIQNVISLNPFVMEKSEVLFGPGSVIYGSDAIGGVMSFQTLTPQLSLEEQTIVTGKALSRYSSANSEQTAHFDINVGWKNWALLSSISVNDYGDLRMGSKGPDEYLRPFYVQRMDNTDVVVANEDPRVQKPSGYAQTHMMQKLRFKPNEKWDFQYGLHYSETSDYSRYDRHIRYKDGLPRYGEWYYGPQKWLMNNLNITHSGNTKLYDQMTLRLAYQFFEESRISRDINKALRETRIEEVDAYSMNLDFVKSIGSDNELFYGFELLSNDVTSTGMDADIISGISVPGPTRYPQSTWASYGLYLSGRHKFSEKTLIEAGMRYNQYKLDAAFDTTFYPFPFTTANINNGALTGSLGFVYHPSESWVLRVGVGSAFRSPNVDDIGKVFDSEPGSVLVPNPDLLAEYAYNAEFGIAHIFGENVKIDMSAYYTLLEDALVRRDFTLNGLDSIVYSGEMSKVQAIQNAARAHVYGMQAAIEVRLMSGLGLSSQCNYQKGEEELDDGSTSPSRHAPPFFGVTRLFYEKNKVNMQFYAVYSAEKAFMDMPEEEIGKDYIYAMDKDGNPYSPGWFTLNYKVLYQVDRNINVSAGLENILDMRYRPYSSGIVAPGRNFVLAMKLHF
jgi:hemoglobin/transferrin/lactoferrin receptor protein